MSDDIRATLAANVRSARAALGISQDELAAQAGIHRTYLGAIERGERNISLASLQKLADAVGRPPSDLLRLDRADG